MAELKINIKVGTFMLHFKNSQGKSEVKAISELKFTTEPDDADNAEDIIRHMFFKIRVGGTAIADMIESSWARLMNENIQRARTEHFVVGKKKADLFRDLDRIKGVLGAKLTEQFKDKYSKITVTVSK